MAGTNGRTQDEIRRELETEREQLASAVVHLRGELGEAANIGAKVQAKLPAAAAAAAATGFVLAGGIGASMRYLARRGRDADRNRRTGRRSIFDRG